MNAILRRLRREDDGTTLAEMVVGMAIMAIFMGMFTGAMLLMSSTVNKVEAVTTSSGQLNNAFLRLDRSVRYATAISQPTRSGASNDWNVEFSATNGTTKTTCTQLRIHAKQLQQRTWALAADGTTYSNLSAWVPLASNITNGNVAVGAPNPPFALVQSAAGTNYQRLTITLVASSGTSTPGTSNSSVTFTAVNSVLTATNNPCQQVAVDATS
jgi:Tfp pilus assembly protein FimT